MLGTAIREPAQQGIHGQAVSHGYGPSARPARKGTGQETAEARFPVRTIAGIEGVQASRSLGNCADTVVTDPWLHWDEGRGPRTAVSPSRAREWP